MNVAVIGLGAMGGGMARSLLRSGNVKNVTGFDLSIDLVREFHRDAAAVGKAGAGSPLLTLKLHEVVTSETDVVVVVLVNETQCQAVCFDGDGGGGGDGDAGESCLMRLMTPNACVMLCSTVSPSFAKVCYERFHTKNVRFLDCPMSGGPARALSGELTMMASSMSSHDDSILPYVQPLLDAMGKPGEIHAIPGGPGMGSTVKMVHQLVAGVHLAVAAEGLALAAAAGVNVQQMYEVVQGAAGASWMLGDRGPRMIHGPGDKVKSALGIFVKDLDIVYSESKRLNFPTPIASTALQQFISGAGLGLARQDDSQVIQVYETLSGVSVQSSSKLGTKGDDGDLWDGEEILEVGKEPRHCPALINEYTRVLRVQFPTNDTTLAHRHTEDTLSFFLVDGGLKVINHVEGGDPQSDFMEFGEVRFGTHKSDELPLVCKITNQSEKDVLRIDAEVLKSPPVTSVPPLVAPHHTLIKTWDKCRVYRLELDPGQSSDEVDYPFFYLTVVVSSSTTMTTRVGAISWEKELQLGDLEWHGPSLNVTITNSGSTKLEQYIVEWR